MDYKKASIGLFAMVLMSALVIAEGDTTFNDSLNLIVNALPIIVLAVSGIISIVVSFFTLLIMVVFVVFFRDVLKLPLDLVKSAMKGMK
jgi:hypothetical protein